MTDGEGQIVRLLTELRDAQREELAYRRRVLDESMAMQRRALRLQRLGLTVVVPLVIVAGAVALVWLNAAGR
jgi:hypothetical protein